MEQSTKRDAKGRFAKTRPSYKELQDKVESLTKDVLHKQYQMEVLQQLNNRQAETIHTAKDLISSLQRENKLLHIRVSWLEQHAWYRENKYREILQRED